MGRSLTAEDLETAEIHEFVKVGEGAGTRYGAIVDDDPYPVRITRAAYEELALGKKRRKVNRRVKFYVHVFYDKQDGHSPFGFVREANGAWPYCHTVVFPNGSEEKAIEYIEDEIRWRGLTLEDIIIERSIGFSFEVAPWTIAEYRIIVNEGWAIDQNIKVKDQSGRLVK